MKKLKTEVSDKEKLWSKENREWIGKENGVVANKHLRRKK